MTPTITAALEELTTELDGLMGTIQALRDEQKSVALPMPTFEQLMALYKKRDQLSNVINNLRAYYCD